MFRTRKSLIIVAALCVILAGIACKKETTPEAPKTPSQPATTPAPAPVEPAVKPTAAPVEVKKEPTPPPAAEKVAAPTPAPAPAPTTPAPAAVPPAAKTAPADTTAKTAPERGKELLVNGLAVAIPAEWVVEPFQPNPMAGTVASYRLAKAEGDSEDAILKISHFPAMKGKDADNITRWLGQVLVDGKPVTKEAANFKVEEKGNVRLTTMDATGAISTSMMGGGTPTAGQRMISAIIDHPQGPHFIKVTGGEKTIAKWRDSIFAMISSATAK